MDEFRVLDDHELGEAAGTPGLTRRVAFEGDDHWFGHVEADPDTMSGWHHDGDTITLGYVLAGQITIEHGPGGSRSMRVGPGGFFTVPAGAIHREGNAKNEAAEVILTRVGEGPPVFPAEKPKPA